MHKQDHLEYTIDLTFFNFLVFVIYKTNLYIRDKAAQ